MRGNHGGPRHCSHSNISLADEYTINKISTFFAAGAHATAATATIGTKREAGGTPLKPEQHFGNNIAVAAAA